MATACSNHCVPIRRRYRFHLSFSAKGDKKDFRAGMNLGAIRSRLDRHHEKQQAALANVELKPDFDSAVPLESLGLTPREAEVLLWIAQGKSNSEIATILGCAENTVKVHIARIFEKLGIENRNAAAMRAVELLSRPTSSG